MNNKYKLYHHDCERHDIIVAFGYEGVYARAKGLDSSSNPAFFPRHLVVLNAIKANK